MVGTTLPANIGSAARAMYTMGLTNLVVVNPRLPIDDTSYANSAGAKSVLDNACIVETLAEALAECSLVLACSARSRHLPRPIITPEQSATLIDHFLHNVPTLQKTDTLNTTPTKPTVAIVFGREDRGLTNEELALADHHVQIPANPDYPVLNVASAIQVISATIFAHFDKKCQLTAPNTPKNALSLITRTDWDEPAISHAQKEALQANLTTLLVRLNLARDNELKDLPSRLSRLTSRLQLDQKEYALLQALMAKLNAKL